MLYVFNLEETTIFIVLNETLIFNENLIFKIKILCKYSVKAFVQVLHRIIFYSCCLLSTCQISMKRNV